jgi:two-component sensor histidine kinase
LNEQNHTLDLSSLVTTLQQTGSVIGSALDLADALNQIAEHVGWVVGAASVRIYSWTPKTKTSAVLAGYVDRRSFAPDQASTIETSRDGDPVFLRALQVGQPWVECANDPDLSIRAQSCLQKRGAQSILYIPLYIQSAVIAYTELCEGRGKFTAEAIAVCQAIAQDAAVAIENARLRNQLQLESEKSAELVREIDKRKWTEVELLRRNRELISLQSAAAAISASLDLDFVLDTVTWEMVNLLGAEKCAISEWDQDADTVSKLTEYGPIGSQEGGQGAKVYDLADYPFRKRTLVERSTRYIAISEPDIDSAELAYMQTAGIKTLLMLPMVFQDRVVGLIEVVDGQAECSFTDYQVSLAQYLATQTASAIENSRLYERAQREIVERMRAEEKIRTTLQEKEVLLKEIHHRVKNNLQVISSLLYLQSKNTEDPKTIEMFQESQDRIRSMALIHDRLYRSQDLNKIDLAEYIHDLATHLVHSYGANSGTVALSVSVDDVFVGVDAAIPCGLIVNELISNSLKHAFPNGRDGEIHIVMHPGRDRELTMVVGDNGVGLPMGLDFRDTETLGLQLVNSLVAQVGGAIELHTDGGTEFKITFTAPQ